MTIKKNLKARPKSTHRLINYAKQLPALLVGIFVALFFAVALGLLLPFLQGFIVDSLNLEHETLVLNLAIFAFVAMLFSVVSIFFQNYFSNKLGIEIAKNLRNEVFKEIVSKPYEFFETRSVAGIMLKINNYITDVGNHISQNVASIIASMLQIFGIFIFALFVNFYLSLAVLGLLILMLLVMMFLSKIERTRATKYKKTETERNGAVLEIINGFETVVSYNQHQELGWRYQSASANHRKIRNKFYLIHTSFLPIMETLWSFANILILLGGFYLISNGLTEIGTIVAFLSYISQMLTPISSLCSGINYHSKAMGIADEIFGIYKKNVSTQRKIVKFAPTNYDINLQNVSFEHKFKGEVLKGVSQYIKEGEKVRVRGAHGSGKSTFAFLLTRLYETNKGKIFIGGTNIRNLSRADLAKTVGMLSDNVSVFEASVKDNIAVAKQDATNEEIEEVLKLSHLDFYTNKLPNKADTIINENIISTGDKELLGFARLLLQNPKIVIIDEACRNMDARAQKRFYSTLFAWVKGKTLIYISSYEKLNYKFDRLLAFDEGKIVNNFVLGKDNLNNKS